MIGAVPAFLSPVPAGTDVSVAERGAELLGLSLFPQGVEIAGVLEARDEDGRRLYGEIAVEAPRRSTKTTAIWATLIGRCATIPGYRVVTTAQDGTRAGEKIREHMELLADAGFEDDGLGTLSWSNGRERIRFAETRSVLWVIAPRPGAFRSAAADVVLFDEAGELDPDKGPALLAGALPLLDTRRKLTGQDPQVIVAGTPGRVRAGLLWESLQRGRAGAPRVGIVDYSLREDEVLVSFDEETGEKVLHEDVLVRVHPGIGTTTDLDTLRERFERMQPADFEAEYGCRWPADTATSALDLEAWAGARVDPCPRPDRVGIAFDVDPAGRSASIVYAWRDVDGVAFVELVAHRPGVSWVARTAHTAAVKYRRVPVAHDSIGANLDPAQALAKLRPVVRLDALATKPVLAAAQRFAEELREGRLRHFGQSDLDAAVANTGWRDVLRSGRAFGQRDPSGAAINPLVAASLALWSYDKARDRAPLQIAV